MIRFDGVDYIAERDNPRLTGQLKRIWEVMKSGEWKSLKEIA